jgi:DNA uptake protein ComE-like DNA-binding protein
MRVSAVSSSTTIERKLGISELRSTVGSKMPRTARSFAILLVLSAGSPLAFGQLSHVMPSADHATAKKTDTKDTAPVVPLLDLNNATITQLEGLPGIGVTEAHRIISGRPFTSKVELLKEGILTKVAYDKIVSSVTVSGN